MTPQPALYLAALTFLEQHHAEHLAPDRRLLIERGIHHLIATADVSANTAEDTVLQAMGELDSRHRREFVDLARTTSFAVFVHDPVSGRKRVFTVADLMKLVRTPALASQPVPSTRTLLANGLADTDSSTVAG